MNVLVIDDDIEITDMLSDILRLKNFSCDISNSGSDGLEKISSNQYDAVLLDLSMPEMSGFEVVEKLHSIGYDLSKVVIVTALTLEHSDEKILTDSGIVHIVRKPFAMNELVLLLQNMG